jgi:hypothetical protein
MTAQMLSLYHAPLFCVFTSPFLAYGQSIKIYFNILNNDVNINVAALKEDLLLVCGS